LPAEAEFCPKCGKPVSLPAKTVSADRSVAVLAAKPEVPRTRSKRRGLLFFLLVILLLGLVVFVATSESPFAQEIQEMAGWKHDQTILDSPFSVGPHTFRYYKFSLPQGSVNVAIVGQFSSESPTSRKAQGQNRNQDRSKDSGTAAASDQTISNDRVGTNDQASGVQVYVLTDAAFTVWQNGYATSSLYDSGFVSMGTVQADIPAGAGVYYLVFSNKAAPNAAKSVHATVLLRYKSWLPQWFRSLKERIWNWTGL
jgi:predicted nucleic acid-binding Zn ribbon protein